MQSLLDPAVLFFALGVFAGLVRSNLEMPAAISKFLSIYLLMALGLKGGFALAASGFTASVASSLGLAVLLAVVVPLVGYALLRRMLSGFNAAAVAATYGSVSAVTFVTATQYLESQSVPYGGYMAAAMALMESPAIILAVMLANALRAGKHVYCEKPIATRLEPTRPAPLTRKKCRRFVADGFISQKNRFGNMPRFVFLFTTYINNSHTALIHHIFCFRRRNLLISRHTFSSTADNPQKEEYTDTACR